jgi:hypothetical protein
MSINYNPSVVTSGLQLYLDAANPKSYPGSGTTWTDLSGFGNHGTLTNGPTYTSANNGSIVFDGAGDYVDCGSSFTGSTLSGLTVETWMYPTSTATSIMVGNGSGIASTTFYLAQDHLYFVPGTFMFTVTGATTYDKVHATFSYQINSWYHIVGTWTPGNRLKIYSNGVDSSRSPAVDGSLQTSLRNGDTNLFLGTRGPTINWYSGNLPAVKIYNRALSDEEVAQNFNAHRWRYGL